MFPLQVYVNNSLKYLHALKSYIKEFVNMFKLNDLDLMTS